MKVTMIQMIIKNNKYKMEKLNKFNKFIQESIRDEMTPKSEEDINSGLEKLLDELKTNSENVNYFSETFMYYLRMIYNTDRELLDALLDNGIFQASDVLITLTDDIDHKENPSEGNKNYKLSVMKGLYELIMKNKDNIRLDELEL